ncbi:hypothetical protein [Saccharibacillus sacchari]|uniref:Uncharacterized protein n=1 Tax=Saccharibacillus sacchari TaxID=456493 RepID=A0ACC6P6F7_9BACL
MWDFILGVAMIAIGLRFLYGTISRGKSTVTVKMLGVRVPIRVIQIVLSLLVLGGGAYLLLR